MKAAGYRVAVLGASSLLGKELITLLEERKFPVSALQVLEGDQAEPDLPIVDLEERPFVPLSGEEGEEKIPLDSDFLFVATLSERLRAKLHGATDARQDSASAPTVIDLTTSVAEAAAAIFRIPFLDHLKVGGQDRPSSEGSRTFASPHAATIMISSLMARLAARFPIETAVAQIFSPASEFGPRAIEELQKQTVNLLSFQKVPQKVFGAQIAFNLLPRLGSDMRDAEALEARIRSQLQSYGHGQTPLPALRLLHAPVFYSIGLSLYVETRERVAPADMVAALEGKPVRIRRMSEKPPSQVEAAGSNEILVDAIQPDASHPRGVWFWAVADNLRLTAANAVAIAESLHQRSQPRNLLS